jgi:hypothetical protein
MRLRAEQIMLKAKGTASSLQKSLCCHQSDDGWLLMLILKQQRSGIRSDRIETSEHSISCAKFTESQQKKKEEKKQQAKNNK